MRCTMRNKKVERLVFMGLCTAIALLLSYVEAVLPPIFSAVPGIKMGLANICIVFALYRFGVFDAALISLVRLVIVSMLFGNPMMFIYSFAGAALSLTVMAILKKLDFMSGVGVSVAGGITHNVGQVLVAMVLLGTAEIGYYMVVLTLTGTLSGVFVGLCGGLLMRYLPKNKF